MNVTVTIPITRAHLAHGVKSNRCSCPVALAIKDVLKPQYRVDVNSTMALVFLYPSYSSRVSLYLPEEVGRLISRFDSGIDPKTLAPFSFDLTMSLEARQKYFKARE